MKARAAVAAATCTPTKAVRAAWVQRTAGAARCCGTPGCAAAPARHRTAPAGWAAAGMEGGRWYVSKVSTDEVGRVGRCMMSKGCCSGGGLSTCIVQVFACAHIALHGCSHLHCFSGCMKQQAQPGAPPTPGAAAGRGASACPRPSPPVCLQHRSGRAPLWGPFSLGSLVTASRFPNRPTTGHHPRRTCHRHAALNKPAAAALAQQAGQEVCVGAPGD